MFRRDDKSIYLMRFDCLIVNKVSIGIFPNKKLEIETIFTIH